MNIRYPIYEGVYRILTFIPRKGFKCSTYFNHKTETNEGFELV